MNKRQFLGIYSQHIKDFIALKRGLGYKYETEEVLLSVFDRFTVQRGEQTLGVTRELASAWCNKNENESSSYRKHRMICLSQLSSYLCQIGIRSYIPRIPVLKTSFTPHIFSKAEIAALFQAADQLRAKRKSMKTIIFSIPAILRFLYATGVRISEVLALQNKDINLDDKYFILRDSKNGRERMIPISQSLAQVCRDYVTNRDKLFNFQQRNQYFFTSCNGLPIKRDAVYRKFRLILRAAGISHLGENRGPRLHDLRHTFSVHSLAMMAENGMDLYCSLPILSTYLGHQSFQSTNSYVRLTAEIYPELLKDVDAICLNVFPNIENYESN
ncbi:MAG: tyrosine-type recombinase/integrase [Bacteroidales bacterium]|nr:tyrosine-type recombinase/integrase [Bacteroidales bacterium]